MKKITTITLIFFIFFTFYIETDGNIYIESNANDNRSITIDSLVPKRGEQNIISTPEIIINYNSEFVLDNYKLYLNYKDVTNKTILTSKHIYYKCNTKLKRGVQVVKIEIPTKDNKVEEIEWYFTVGTPFYNNYKGIFFNNTKELNMLTSYDDLNNLCKNTNHLDYVFITEKINNKENNKSDIHVDSKKYKKLIDSCNKFTNNNDFISIPGFELSTKLKDEKNKTEINIFNCEYPFLFKDNISLPLLYKKLFYYEGDLICQFKANNNLSNIDYFKYSPYGDQVITLLELNKKRDTKENRDVLNIDTYKEALNNGWHVSPITCQYNDYPNWNISKDLRTTILCEDLSKSKILDAIKNRRIYVSEDNNLDIFFSLNKMPMGSIVKSPSYIRLIVSAINNDDYDKIKKIEVFSNNNEIVYTKEFNSNYAKVDFTLKLPKKNTYYFALITEDSNKKSITSPVWVEP
ncbi:hypothetical protein TPELB_15970 [Terrisporobacter petrolearius]|uniref:Ig-like domain-containing protein n=1 Tax=Terrisporobacter petrolearius TaxID=1460447 RepID=A0ABZ3FC31_9FIRM